MRGRPTTLICIVILTLLGFALRLHNLGTVPLRGDELRGCWRPIPAGRVVGPDAILVVDPLGPVFAVPGGIWADPEA